MDSYAVIKVDEKVLDDDVNISNDLIEIKLKEELDKIYSEMDKLEPQQKMFFLDRLLLEILGRSELPILYANTLVERLKEQIKDLDKRSKEEIREQLNNYTASYLG